MARSYQKDVYKFEPDHQRESDTEVLSSIKSMCSKETLPNLGGIVQQHLQPGHGRDPSTSRSGPRAAVLGSTRSPEVKVKPAKRSSSTAFWVVSHGVSRGESRWETENFRTGDVETIFQSRDGESKMYPKVIQNQ